MEQFIREKIKDKPLNKKRLAKKGDLCYTQKVTDIT